MKYILVLVIQIAFIIPASATEDEFLFCMSAAQKNWGFCKNVQNQELKQACVSAGMRLWTQCNVPQRIQNSDIQMACLGAGREDWSFCRNIKSSNLAKACELGAKKFWNGCEEIR